VAAVARATPAQPATAVRSGVRPVVARGMVNMGMAQQRIQSSVAQARAAQQRQQEQQRRAEWETWEAEERYRTAPTGLGAYFARDCTCDDEGGIPVRVDGLCSCVPERQRQQQQQQQQQNAAAAAAAAAVRATPAQPATAVRSGIRPVVVMQRPAMRTAVLPILPGRPR
jgi:hypothetical protein